MTNKVVYAVLYISAAILAVLCLGPFLLMIVNATRSGNEIMTSVTLIPGSSLPENWQVVTSNLDIPRGFLNSLLIAVSSTVLNGYFSALAAFAFCFYKFRGRSIIFTAVITLMMVPAQLGLLGFYDLVNMLRMVDTYWPLILPAIASPATVFFLRQYAASVVPPAILEAPRIDGASEITIFHRIVMPIMAPGIATMAIGGFIGSWNNYLLPLVLINTPSKFTLPLMVGSLNSTKDIANNQGAIYLTVAVSVVPIIVVFCFCSKYIISSISAGSVKE